jgi:hypothetical protein
VSYGQWDHIPQISNFAYATIYVLGEPELENKNYPEELDKNLGRFLLDGENGILMGLCIIRPCNVHY